MYSINNKKVGRYVCNALLVMEYNYQGKTPAQNYVYIREIGW